METEHERARAAFDKRRDIPPKVSEVFKQSPPPSEKNSDKEKATVYSHGGEAVAKGDVGGG